MTINITMWWVMGPWFELMVEVLLQLGLYLHRTNNKCRLVRDSCVVS
jgi:hypothetical protein